MHHVFALFKSVGIVVALCAAATGIYGLYVGYRTVLEFENAATAVAIVVCIAGSFAWGPLNRGHGSRLTQDGDRPTPVTGNLRNQYRGVILLAGGISFLGLVIGTHYLLS